MERGFVLKPRSHFLKVKCAHCSSEQIFFEKPAMDVKCRMCRRILVKSTGGKGKVSGEILEVYE
ncbi:MAG: 30S ribosomal protein S27e [Thermoproteota archaeon]